MKAAITKILHPDPSRLNGILVVNMDLHNIEPNREPNDVYHEGWVEFFCDKQFNDSTNIADYVVDNYMTCGNLRYTNGTIYTDHFVAFQEAYCRVDFNVVGIKIIGDALKEYALKNNLNIYFYIKDTFGQLFGFVQRLAMYINGEDISKYY